MSESENKLFDIVRELNSEMYDAHGDVTEQWFYTSSGFVDVIGFGDIMLWNSEDGDRKWVESKNDFEPMKPFLIKQLKEYGKLLIKLAKK